MKNKCNHKWEVGSPIFIDGEFKIKTECEICGEEFLAEFGDTYQKSIDEEDFKKISCLDKRERNKKWQQF